MFITLISLTMYSYLFCKPYSTKVPLATSSWVALIHINVGFDAFWHYDLRHIHIIFLACMTASIPTNVEEKDAGRITDFTSSNWTRKSNPSNILNNIRHLGTNVSQYISKCRAVVLYTDLDFLSLSIWLIDRSARSRVMSFIELLVFPDQQASQSEGQNPGEEAECCTDSHSLGVSWFLIGGKGICSQKRTALPNQIEKHDSGTPNSLRLSNVFLISRKRRRADFALPQQRLFATESTKLDCKRSVTVDLPSGITTLVV